ncbi:hypothetical protein G9P44_006099 [Scheffersomyces stipitis]|nr:hypothetical protein G9P44_006099 [Scheffersomyces stipitis]
MTQITPIKGFTNTPVTQSICVIITLLALSLSILQLKHIVRLAIDPYIVEYSQYWRIFTFQASVINESDYLLVVFLWFHFKNIERFYGSRRYLSVITIFAVYNAVVCFIVMCIGQLVSYYAVYVLKTLLLHRSSNIVYQSLLFNEVIPGPQGIISSLYICYGTYVPVSYHFKILLSNPMNSDQDQEQQSTSSSSKELNLTNHFPIHIIYTLLLLNNGTRSLIPCLVGLLLGKLHVYELLPGSKNWMINIYVFRFFVDPTKFVTTTISSIGLRLRSGYQSLNSSRDQGQPIQQAEFLPAVTVADLNEEVEGEDVEEIVEDGRQQATQIRAETPVRPLGSQFLDTFRN